MAVMTIIPTAAIQSARRARTAKHPRHPEHAFAHRIPSLSHGGARRGAADPGSAHSTAWMRSTSDFSSGVMAYFS